MSETAMLLLLACALLVVRLPALWTDEPIPGSHWVHLSWPRILALVVCGPWSTMLLLVGIGGVIDALQILLERRTSISASDPPVGRPRVARSVRWIRLGSLGAHSLLLFSLTSPRLGLSARSWVSDSIAWAGSEFPVLMAMSEFDHTAFLIVGLGALLCLNEANLLVRALIDEFGVRPSAARPSASPGVISMEEFNRGRVIGMLERLLVYLLVIKGEYAALGLVLTAKGLARFKNLDDREFAEYFMVGTLLSLLVAGLLAEVVRAACGLV